MKVWGEAYMVWLDFWNPNTDYLYHTSKGNLSIIQEERKYSEVATKTEKEEDIERKKRVNSETEGQA